MDKDTLDELEREIAAWEWYGGNTRFPVSAQKVLSLISAARQQETVISDEVVERMMDAYDEHPMDPEAAMRAALSLLPVRVEGSFQARVEPWMRECFGDVIPFDKLERGDRLLEEVLELLQSGDYPPDRVLALRDYVYGRPVGEPAQEVGGVMVTLAAYCLAFGLDMHEAGETELARIWTKVPQIRAKQAAKPVGSALPMLSAAPRAEGSSPSQPSRTTQESPPPTPCDLEGRKLDPVEPTREMWAASGDAIMALPNAGNTHHDQISEAVYRAMLAAAPEARSPIGASPAERQPSPREDPNSPLPTSPEVR